ncbi:MAG: radical SAM protein, partial [Chloroflexota bacterium]
MSFNITLISCYELGHQPLSLAWPWAKFKQAKLDAAGYDISIKDFPAEAIIKSDMIAISVPMHTALRLGVQAAIQIREINPSAHIIFYGLYAWLNREFLLAEFADSIIGGEYEDGLVQMAIALKNNTSLDQVEGITTLSSKSHPNLPRQSFLTPERTTLPPLEDYAHYTHLGEHHINGYVEASRGCLHTCQHCPVVPIYNGRFFVVPFETVMADIRQQVLAGAKHITFGDPDFLNGPGHALKIIRQLHQEFP